MGVKSINEVTLLGHTGREAEIRTTTTGQKVGNLSVATSRGWKNASGEWENETTWHYVTAWGKEAEKAEKIPKGAAVLVTGRIAVDKYTGKDGVEKRTVKIVAYSINQVLSEKSDPNSRPHAYAQPKNPVQNREAASLDDFDDDIPF